MVLQCRLTEPNGSSSRRVEQKVFFLQGAKRKKGDPLLGLLEENLLDVLAVKVSLVKRLLELEKEEDTSERNLKWSDCM